MRLTSSSGGRAASAAFTLIELLTVIAIIGILAAITFGVSRGVNERAAINQARAELSAIAAALEAYKRQYGDYPQNASVAQLAQALIGKLGPKLDPIDSSSQKKFIDVAVLALSADPYTSTSAVIQDPWGREYKYYYKTGSNWKNPSFLLFSVGPDGTLQGSIPDNGFLTSTFDNLISSGKGNIDNIYANR